MVRITCQANFHQCFESVCYVIVANLTEWILNFTLSNMGLPVFRDPAQMTHGSANYFGLHTKNKIRKFNLSLHSKSLQLPRVYIKEAVDSLLIEHLRAKKG